MKTLLKYFIISMIVVPFTTVAFAAVLMCMIIFGAGYILFFLAIGLMAYILIKEYRLITESYYKELFRNQQKGIHKDELRR